MAEPVFVPSGMWTQVGSFWLYHDFGFTACVMLENDQITFGQGGVWHISTARPKGVYDGIGPRDPRKEEAP